MNYKVDDWNIGDVTCNATIPDDMEVEAHFLAKEDGIVAGIALANIIFNEVDSSLKVTEHLYFCGLSAFV